MKYFLPNLYVELNSPDENLADAAEAKVERAGEKYEQRWDEIRSQLPLNVVEFHDEQNLHDANVLALAETVDSAIFRKAGDVVVVVQRQTTSRAESENPLVLLHYLTTEKPRVEIPTSSNVFHGREPIWLYDEFDLQPSGAFSHSILIGDGRVCTIYFKEFCFGEAKIVEPQMLKKLAGVPLAVSRHE